MVGSNGQGSNSQGAAYLYDIAVWADIAGSTGETRSHFATGLTNGLEHTFAVRAVNDGGASVRSDQVSETPAGGRLATHQTQELLRGADWRRRGAFGVGAERRSPDHRQV